jgi:hypothetical protein
MFLGCTIKPYNFKPVVPPTIYTGLKDTHAFADQLLGPSPSDEKVFSNPPKLIKKGILRYPKHLRMAAIEGEVLFLVRIKKDGSIEELAVHSYNHIDLVDAARKAIETSRYETIEEDMEFFLPIRFSMLMEGSCEVHGDVWAVRSQKNDFYICPKCYPAN